MKSMKPWYSLWSFPAPYSEAEAPFIDNKLIACSQVFSRQFKEIQEEVQQFIRNQSLKPYFKDSMVKGDQGYQTLSLKWWGINFYKNQKQCPVLTQIIKSHPEISTLSINKLAPKSRILPHMGDTNAIYRGHFGITIPGKLPHLGIKVKSEEANWTEGQFIWFMDAFEHETWNDTEFDRYVLLVDVLRPEFYLQKHSIYATVMTSMFLQKRMEISPWLKKNSTWIVSWFAPLLIPIARIRIAWINFIKKY
jgi:aspartyl/asparaginyl beta-hydroxylase (cupin superfamily)